MLKTMQHGLLMGAGDRDGNHITVVDGDCPREQRIRTGKICVSKFAIKITYYVILANLNCNQIYHFFFSNSEVENLLVDPENYDFRPNPDNEMTIDDEGNFIGPYSPMIGSHLMDPMDPTSSYEGNYWIPGHRSNKASFPIPPHKAAIKKMRDVVMCQTGYK